MKRIRVIGLPMRVVGLSVALTLTLAGGLALADLAGSKHDFSAAEWADGDRCIACHAEDRREPPKTPPLWDPDADLSRKFGRAVGREKGSPGLGTLICLRCHDGTIARDTVGSVISAKGRVATGRAGGTTLTRKRFTNKRSGGMFRAGPQTTDHPVGVKYPQFDRSYRPLTSVVASRTVRLPNGQVECTSCHDPHNAAALPHMLVTTNTRSTLCLTCHKK